MSKALGKHDGLILNEILSLTCVTKTLNVTVIRLCYPGIIVLDSVHR